MSRENSFGSKVGTGTPSPAAEDSDAFQKKGRFKVVSFPEDEVNPILEAPPVNQRQQGLCSVTCRADGGHVTSTSRVIVIADLHFP